MRGRLEAHVPEAHVPDPHVPVPAFSILLWLNTLTSSKFAHAQSVDEWVDKAVDIDEEVEELVSDH